MHEYVEVVLRNLDQGSRVPLFGELVTSLDSAYRTIIHDPPPSQKVFLRFLLICHKSLLSAAALIAQRQPEDAGAITRRAVECARVALAVKLNDQNGMEWLSFQKRHDRWLSRRQGEKPAHFAIKFNELRGEPIAEELDRWLGIYSDAVVHFTPEFYDSLDWHEQDDGDAGEGIFLNYFHTSDLIIERSVLTLIATHGTILKAFGRCFDGGISADANKLLAIRQFWAIAKAFNEGYQERKSDQESGASEPYPA